MLYLYQHTTGSQVFLSRDVLETLTDLPNIGEGFLVDSMVSLEGDLISVIIEKETLEPEERLTLETHYEKVISMMEKYNTPRHIQLETQEEN